MDKTLGKITKVDLRKAWKNEEYDFSAWLSEEVNLALLSEEIGIDIRLMKKEAEVGKYSLDILAEEEATGRKIVIENQLETTNHDHLGKIITYAAGYDADIIIWIFREIREEHRQAIDWLNENTNEDVAFFAVKLELWQIDNSVPAPKFQIISSPNEWAKILKQGGNKDELTDTKLKQLDFWTKLKTYAQEQKSPIKFQTPRPQHWYDVSIGFSEAHILLTVNTRDNFISCGLYVSNDKKLYTDLKDKEIFIEKELNVKLEWRDRDVASLIIDKKDGFDIQDEQNMQEYFNWLIERTLAFSKVFGKLIKEYKKY
ncbi:DUF4268 domain-containing protein [Patescibacteria group bacterium]|nr:DUF4268 domain-containing protein [Patescibacteria group bacterium]